MNNKIRLWEIFADVKKKSILEIQPQAKTESTKVAKPKMARKRGKVNHLNDGKKLKKKKTIILIHMGKSKRHDFLNYWITREYIT